MNELEAVDHIAINVADLEKSARWYLTSFHCAVAYRDRSRVDLTFSNIKLSLVLPSSEPPHLGFVRNDAASFGELAVQGDGTAATFLSDPAGNVVEIVQRK
jgi:catechol 2,3-dioxygenase-like lactoylglutathione lyase family enzyme